MPVGVITSISSPPSAGSPLGGDVRSFMFAGLTERGDTATPIIARSFAEFVDLTGSRTTYGTGYDQAQTFFGELAGRPGRIVFQREVGASATKGTVTLADASVASALKVTAKDEGAWSAGVTVQPVAGILSGTFSLLVNYAGQTEQYLNLTSNAAAVSALQGSAWVRGTDMGGGLPAVAGSATALSAGSDDRGAVTATTLLAALDQINSDYGPGLVAIPGQSYTAVAAGLAAHCVAHGRIGLVAVSAATSAAGAKTAATSLRATPGAERLGLVYPSVTIPDGAGGQRTISPEGFAAGRRGEAIDQTGPWAAPFGGQFGRARYVTGVDVTLTSDQINTLDDAAVSCIRLTPGGVQLYGWRSLSTDLNNWMSLADADLINDIAYRGGLALEDYVGQTVDGLGRFLTHVANDMRAILAPIAEAGGLYANPNGNPPDPGYRVDVGPSVNTPATLARGEVRAALEVRPSPHAQYLRLFLSRVPLTANL